MAKGPVPADALHTLEGQPMWPLFEPPHMPCDACGASVARAEHAAHVCDPQRRVDYSMFQLREEVVSFDDQLSAYLASPRGRFAVWLAARQREEPDS
jgi:hypothetical protein